MSVTQSNAEIDPEPFFILPGFMPDAVGFAFRTSLALLLAYYVSFLAQLDTASSAGLCVAIVAQPAPGMAMSKALYRMAGTVLGGIVAVLLVAAFSQDRTMLLASFTLWLAACTFVAALLRDFRSYGAVLCGYTVGIIAISNIDTPQGALQSALNRVAAILIGIAAVAVVNSVFARASAYEGLVAALRAKLASTTAMAMAALAGHGAPDERSCIEEASAILALQTLTTYSAAELPDGPIRSAGARNALAGLLGMVASSRVIGGFVGRSLPDAPAQRRLDELRAALADPGAAALRGAANWVATPPQAFLLGHGDDLLRQHALARNGLAALLDEAPPGRLIRLRAHHDVVGAAIGATRTIIAVGLGAVFCVVSDWPGATGLLVQQAAFTALLGMQPNPTAAARNMAVALPFVAVAAALAGFVMLPAASGFVPFGMTIVTFSFVASLLARHPRTASLGPGLILYFTLLLAPSNIQSFDLSSFVNNVAVQILAILFMMTAFYIILPVSPQRRLFRIAHAIARDLRRTMMQGRPLDQAAAQSLQFDRLSQAQIWLGPRTPARLRVQRRMYAFAELDLALRRAWSALDRAALSVPLLAGPIATARASLTHPRPGLLVAAADALLAQAEAANTPPDVLLAVYGLRDAGRLLGLQSRALVLYSVMEA